LHDVQHALEKNVQLKNVSEPQPRSDRGSSFRLTLDDVDDLAGHVAAEANHCAEPRVRCASKPYTIDLRILRAGSRIKKLGRALQSRRRQPPVTQPFKAANRV
jgi:hypothetical protein